MKHTESTLQKRCVNWFRLNYPKHLRLIAIPNGGARNAITGAILKGEGVVAGAPDLFLFHAAQGFHGLAIEMKSRIGKQSESQKAFEADIDIEGYKYVVCRSFEEFQAVVNEYFKK